MKNLPWILVAILIALCLYLLFLLNNCKSDSGISSFQNAKRITAGELFDKYQSSIVSRDSLFAGISISKNLNDSLHGFTSGWSTVEYVLAIDSNNQKTLLVAGLSDSIPSKPQSVNKVIILTQLDSKHPKMDIVKIDNTFFQMAQTSGNKTTKLIMETFFNSAKAKPGQIYTCPTYCPIVAPANLTSGG